MTEWTTILQRWPWDPRNRPKVKTGRGGRRKRRARRVRHLTVRRAEIDRVMHAALLYRLHFFGITNEVL